MNTKTTLALIKDILDEEMNMPIGRVFAYNASQDLPKDDNLFIVLHYNAKLPYSNNVRYEETRSGYMEKQTMNIQEDITISLISKNTDARERCQEVLFALKSTYSQGVQDINRLHISSIGEIYDASFLEATARLNRFDVRIRVIRAYDKEKIVKYYDTFEFDIWTESKGGSLTKKQFTIKEDV